MNDKTKNSDQKIDYQFTPVPINIIYLTSLEIQGYLTYHISKYNYYLSVNALNDGFYFLSNDTIKSDINISKDSIQKYNETLYRVGILFIKSAGTSGQRETNHYSINWDMIKEYGKLTIEQCKMPNHKISIYKRGEVLTYRNDVIVPAKPITELNDEPRDKNATKLNNYINLNNINKISNLKNNNDYNKNAIINNFKILKDEIDDQLLDIFETFENHETKLIGYRKLDLIARINKNNNVDELHKEKLYKYIENKLNEFILSS